MWRRILTIAIKALIASGLAGKAKEKIGGWLKRKFNSSVAKAKNKVAGRYGNEIAKLSKVEKEIAELLKEQAAPADDEVDPGNEESWP